MSRDVSSLAWARLPRFSRGQAALARMAAAHLLGRPRSSELASTVAELLGGAQPTFDMAPAMVFAPDELASRLAGTSWAAARVRRADGLGFAVIVDGALASRLAARVLGTPARELPAPRGATPVEKGVLACVVAALLEAHADPCWCVDGVVDDLQALAAILPDSRLWGVDALCRVGTFRGLVRFVAPQSLLSVVSSRPRPELLARLLGTIRVIGGRVALTAAEVAALEPGDVVLLDSASVGPTGEGGVLLAIGRGALRAEHADGLLSVTEPYCEGATKGASMLDTPDAAILDNLPVSLVCQLAAIQMSAREAAALGPGAVVPLGRPVGSPVELVSGEQVVARGELVDVEGELGIRITELPGVPVR